MRHNAEITCAPPEVKTTGCSPPVIDALGAAMTLAVSELLTMLATSELVITYLVATPSSFFDVIVGKTKLLSPFKFDTTETVSVTVDEEAMVVSTFELERASRRRLASMFVVAGGV